jgi:hypothetical protein
MDILSPVFPKIEKNSIINFQDCNIETKQNWYGLFLHNLYHNLKKADPNILSCMMP